MSGEFEDLNEKTPSGGQPIKTAPTMTLEKAISMGEYDEKYLSTFAEWQTLNNNLRFNYIIQAIKHRRFFLNRNYAETFNVIDFSQKPELKKVLDAITDRLAELQKDEERIRIEYSSKL